MTPIPAAPDPIARWAAAHAATVPAGRPTAAVSAPGAAQAPVPAVLASCTEIQAWDTGTFGGADLALARDPGGRLLLATASARTVTARVWDPVTAEPLNEVSCQGSISALGWGFTPDGRPLLAVGSWSADHMRGFFGRIQVWDPFSTEPPRTLALDTIPVASLAWGYRPDGHPLLVTASDASPVRIWDPMTGDCLSTILPPEPDEVASVCYGYQSDGQGRMVTVARNGTVGVWDPDTGQLVQTLQAPRLPSSPSDTPVTSAWGYQPDGRALLAAAAGSGIRFWAEHDGEFTTAELPDARYAAWAPPADGRVLLATATPGAIQLRDAHDGRLLHEAPVDAASRLDWIAAPDGRLLLAIGERGERVRIWDVALDPPVRSASGMPRARGDRVRVRVRARAAPRPDAGDGPGPPPVVLAAVTETRTWRTEAAAVAVGLGMASDGRLLLAVSEDGGPIGIWDPGTGQLVRRLTGAAKTAYSVAWGHLADGRPQLAAGSEDGTARIWDMETGELVHTLARPSPAAPPHVVDKVAWGYRADGRPLLAASGDHDTAPQIWDPETGELLRVLDGHQGFMYSLSWGYRSSGELLLATAGADGTARIWDAATWTTSHVLSSPGRRVRGAAWAARPGGQPVVATVATDENAIRLWDEDSRGEFTAEEHDLGTGTPYIVSWVSLPDGRLLLAGRTNEAVFLLDGQTLELLHSMPAESRGQGLHNFDWAVTPDGELLLAGTSEPDQVHVWSVTLDPPAQAGGPHALASGARPPARTGTGTGDAEGRLVLPPREVTPEFPEAADIGEGTGSVAAISTADGRTLLATTSVQQVAHLWDLNTGRHLRALAGHNSYLVDASWWRTNDGRLLIATGSGDDTVRIWDADSGQCLHTLTGHNDWVRSVAWAQDSNGQLLLATGSDGGPARIWDIATPAVIATLPGAESDYRSIDWARDQGGNLLLLVVNHDRTAGPVRAWLVETGPAGGEPATAAGAGRLGTRPAGGADRQLLRLGAGGLWPPLGLVADLVTLTGPDMPTAASDLAVADGTATGAALCDPRLAVLASEPGIARLRDLATGEPRWAPGARAAFAALLASAIAIPARYAPPDDADPAALSDALARALGGATARAPGGARTEPPTTRAGVSAETPRRTANAPVPAWRAPAAELRAAAAGVTGQVIALLAILGPDACAADPILPLRLAHHAPALPVLSPRELRLLTAPGTRPATGTTVSAGATVWSPGTAGVARSGPLTRLLPTQLALPRDLLATRLAEDQLLYRQHWAPLPPAPEPVTIILDTTPPTFGPAGNTLRLAAHLITTTLWDHGRYPALITLTEPDAVTELRAPADLIRIWTSATLDDPAARLATARQTAAGTGQPAVLCTHFQTARDAGYRPGPAARLLTTHQPPEQPPAGPAPWHAHLPPGPERAQLAAAIGMLLTNGQRDGG